MRRWEARNQDFDSCEVIAKSSDDTLLHYVADVWTDMDDARLIAAAPELLERLKEVVERLNMYESRCTSPGLCRAEDLVDRLEGKV